MGARYFNIWSALVCADVAAIYDAADAVGEGYILGANALLSGASMALVNGVLVDANQWNDRGSALNEVVGEC